MKDKGVFVNPLTDFGFKLLFGTAENKELLIHFLNQILPDDHQIQDLTLLPLENLGENEKDRRAIFDVNAEGMKKERYILEMQNGSQKNIRDRSLYYPSFVIRQQGPKGNWDYELPAIFIISVLNFRFPEKELKKKKRVLHKIRLKDQDGNIFYSKFGQFYLEVPNFKKTIKELETLFDKWVYLLKELSTMTEIPEGFEEAIFQKVFAIARIAGFSEERRKKYYEFMKRHNDYQNTLDYQRELGREEKEKEYSPKLEAAKTALELERSKAIEARRNAIQGFRKLGISNEDIASFLNLTLEEVLKF